MNPVMSSQTTVGCQTADKQQEIIDSQAPVKQQETVDVIPTSWLVGIGTYGLWCVTPYTVSIPFITGAAIYCYANNHKKEVSDAAIKLSTAAYTRATDTLRYVGGKALETATNASSYIASKAWAKISKVGAYLASTAIEKGYEAVSFAHKGLTGCSARQITRCEPMPHSHSSAQSVDEDSTENTNPIKLKQD